VSNASNTSVAVGYDVFRNSHCACGAPGHKGDQPSRVVVNAWLRMHGYDEISNKTYTYYVREYASGQKTWVPINQFNVLVEMSKTAEALPA